MHKIRFLMGTFISNRGSAPFLISTHIHSRVFLWIANAGMALSVTRWSEWSTSFSYKGFKLCVLTNTGVARALETV